MTTQTPTPMEPLNKAELAIIEKAKNNAANLMNSVTSQLCIHYRRELTTLQHDYDDAHKQCVTLATENAALEAKRKADVRRIKELLQLGITWASSANKSERKEALIGALSAINVEFTEDSNESR